MSRYDEMKAVLEQTSFEVGARWRNVLFLCIAIGIIGFIGGLFGDQSYFAWQALLVNTIFFGGISLGGLVFSLIFTITNAHWGRPIKRLAEAMAGFIPASAVFFILLFFCAEHFFEWMDPQKVIHSKAGWLNFPFFIARNVVLFAVVAGLAWIYLKAVIRPDIGLARKLISFGNSFADRFIQGYGTQKKEEALAVRRARTIAPVLGLLFSLLCTLQAFDWMMSIDQEWFSTLFGVQYAMANLIGAAAVLMIVAGIVRRKFSLHGYITIARYHDIGKLTFAACLMWTYMIFSQVLVIWYGNLPEETPYLVLRMQSLEWGWMFWFIMVLMFILPFFGLMSRTACNSIWFSRLIAGEILVGLWLEKYFLIVPSIQENKVAAGILPQGRGLPGFGLNVYDVSITLGVLGVFLFCYLWFLQRVPLVPVSDQNFFNGDNPQ